MSAKAPGAGESGERMDNGGARQRNEACSSLRGHFPLTVLAFLCEIRVLGWFVYLCMGFPRSILKVFRARTQWESMGHLWLQFRPNPSVFLEIRFRPMFTSSLSQAKFSFRHPRTPDRRTHRCKFNSASKNTWTLLLQPYSISRRLHRQSFISRTKGGSRTADSRQCPQRASSPTSPS